MWYSHTFCVYRRQRLPLGVLLYQSPLYFLSQSLSLNVELTVRARLADNPQGSPWLHSPVLGLRIQIAKPVFYIGI